MKRLITVFLSLIAIFLFSSCADTFFNSDKKETTGNFLFDGTITGRVEKGPFVIGSAVTIFELDSDLEKTGNSVSGVTIDDIGSFVVKADFTWPYIEITANGKYYDELTAQISTLPLSLGAVASLEHDSSINVNILTSIAKYRIKYLITREAKDFNSALKQAEKEIYINFTGMAPDDDISMLKASLAKNGKIDGFLLFVSALLQHNKNSSQVAQWIETISKDLEEDGVFSEEKVVRFIAGKFMDIQTSMYMNSEFGLNLQSVEENLQKFYIKAGIDASVPDANMYALGTPPYFNNSGKTTIPKPFIAISGDHTGAYGHYASDVEVTLSTPLPDADIYYRVMPFNAQTVINVDRYMHPDSNRTLYTKPFNIAGPVSMQTVLAVTVLGDKQSDTHWHLVSIKQSSGAQLENKP